MKVKVLRPFWYGGEVKAVGYVVELPDALGREVVYGQKAERVIDPPAKPAEQKPVVEQKKPMTTVSASVLAGKKGA